MKALFICLVIGGSGIGYVWQKNQIHQLGKQYKDREVALEEKKRLNKLRRDKLNELQSPRMLEARIKQLNLGLVLPQQSQIVRLPEPLPPGVGVVAPGKQETLYARRRESNQASP